MMLASGIFAKSRRKTMTMNGRVNEKTASAVAPTMNGRSYEDSLMCAVYVILACLFSVGFLAGIATVYLAQWIW